MNTQIQTQVVNKKAQLKKWLNGGLNIEPKKKVAQFLNIQEPQGSYLLISQDCFYINCGKVKPCTFKVYQL